MAEDPQTFDLIVRLGARENRADTARALARRLGVETVLLYVRDPEIDALVPAPGFPQTLRGGRAWRAFLAGVGPGRTTGEVDLPSDVSRPVVAVAVADAAVIALGGHADEHELATVERLLPLLARALVDEQRVLAARAEADEARDAASRARTLTEAVETARAEAGRLNAELRLEHRRKDDFLAMLAHELRNPLAPLATSIEVLRLRGTDSDVSERQLDVMTRQIAQLTRLIEDLLDVSRVSRGRIELRRRRVVLREVLADALEASNGLLEARRHEVVCSLPEEPVWLHADPVRLTQVFANLLHNAAKYTDPGGRVTITARLVGDHVEVRLEDNGIGISAEMLPHVFDLFTQAPVSLDRSQGGLGIGLTLARSLVELHGGEIEAESAGLGEGSAFILRLPLAHAGANAAVAHAPEAEAPPDGLRVLVVDDNEDAADALAKLLQIMGHEAEVAYSGLAALQIAPDLDADLVLLDIGLPDMDGYEVARRLRRNVSNQTRFVALTGYGSGDDKRRAHDAGFDDHVVKPMGTPTLKALLARAIGDRGGASRPILRDP